EVVDYLEGLHADLRNGGLRDHLIDRRRKDRVSEKDVAERRQAFIDMLKSPDYVREMLAGDPDLAHQQFLADLTMLSSLGGSEAEVASCRDYVMQRSVKLAVATFSAEVDLAADEHVDGMRRDHEQGAFARRLQIAIDDLIGKG